MGHDDEGDPFDPVQLLEKVKDGLSGLGIQISGGFIGQQDLRF